MTPDLATTLRSWKHLDGAVPSNGGAASASGGLALRDWYPSTAVADPGDYPYIRNRTPRGYLEGLWVMGQYSGFATPRETNARFIDLLARGQTGLSVALDLPTQMGFDSDSALADGEVGRVGVPLDTVDDVVRLFAGVPLERVRQIRTTANAIGPIFAAFFLAALEELGVDPAGFRLMLQNDPLKEFSARGTFVFPPDASVEFAVDVIEYFENELPHWEPIEFCGYHIRDAGGTAVHEVAVMTANGIAYLERARARGVDISKLANTLHLFLSAGVDIFEEAAKLRMARGLWAKLLHEVFDVPKELAGVKIFTYTLGGALYAQQPMNNIVRVTCEALAAVLGGADTLATSSYDEALGLPSPAAAQLALRTQQIIAHESGATKVVDPLGGSTYVEELRATLEDAVLELVAQLIEEGGAVAAIESGSVASLISDAAFRYQREVETGERQIVGVNLHAETDEVAARGFVVPSELQAEQVANLAETKRQRSDRAVQKSLESVRSAAHEGRNTVPSLIEAARVRATLGEIVESLAEVYGHYPSARSTAGQIL